MTVCARYRLDIFMSSHTQYDEQHTVNRPEAAEDPEKTTLTTTVWTLDDKVFSLLDFERHRLDEDIAVRAHDRNVVESDVCGFDDPAPAGQDYWKDVRLASIVALETDLSHSPLYSPN
jgi:hypothetical protein